MNILSLLMSDPYSFLTTAEYKKQSEFQTIAYSIFFAFLSTVVESLSNLTVMATMHFKQDPDLME